MTITHTHRRLRWRNLALLALLLAQLLWPLQFFAERYYRNRLAEQNHQTLALYTANLLGNLHRFEALPGILADLPPLRAQLATPHDDERRNQANHLLARLRNETGAGVIYLMNTQGRTLSSSNWDQQDSFVGEDFSYRPYFREARAGKPGRFLGLGTTSRKRGYFFSSPVYEAGQVIGILVVKVDLDASEALWGKTPEQLMVTDNNGVVIVSSRSDWRYRATRELDKAERAAIRANQTYPTPSLAPLHLDDNVWLIQSRQLEGTELTASILAPRQLVDREVRAALVVGAAALLVLLLLLGLLLQRRRHYIERIALDSQARRELEVRVLERTRDLETLNNRLKGEVLEREQAQQKLVRTQDELVQAGKLSALGTMSASISHELNQPLAAIRSYADNAGVLLDHQRLDDARGNLRQISELTGRMASIIAHLRAFARRDRHAPESVALQPALDDALALLAKRRRALDVELIRDLPEATLWVQAGETRLRQVLGNLLANALDALSEKALPRRIWLSAEVDTEYVSLRLRDNGPGFSAQALAHAREPFFTTKTSTQGLGLGLAICETLMRALGGELQMSNHPEGGALITLQLRNSVPGATLQQSEEFS